MDVLGKGHWKPFIPRSNRSQIVGEQIHANVNGPMSLKSLRGAKYYVCFKDDYIKYCRVSSSRKRMKFPSIYASSQMKCRLLGHRVKMFR